MILIDRTHCDLEDRTAIMFGSQGSRSVTIWSHCVLVRKTMEWVPTFRMGFP